MFLPARCQEDPSFLLLTTIYIPLLCNDDGLHIFKILNLIVLSFVVLLTLKKNH